MPKHTSKEKAFTAVKAWLKDLSIEIAGTDDQRPWGGFFVISQASTDHFINTFFPELGKDEIYKYGSELRPKILLVGPHQELSWQYHNRRAELWKVAAGSVGVMTSPDNAPPDTYLTLAAGEFTKHDNQVRHRLIGLDRWGVVAEIWQHTIKDGPSNEEDIVRLEDSYGRS